MSPAVAGSASDLVPVASRLRYTQMLRFGIGVLILCASAAAPQALGGSFSDVWAPTMIYLGLAAVAELGWRVVSHRALLLFGAMLMVDGVYLGWVSYLTGSVFSHVRFLILIHVVAVTLLASYRTGLKIAMWNSLVLFGVYNAQETGTLTPVGTNVTGLPGTNFERLA